MERHAVIVAGFGCRAGADAASLRAALHAAWGDRPLAALAAPTDRLPLLAPLAATLDVAVIGIAPGALAATDTPTRSAASLAARRVGSVAEAAALAAAGPGARIIVARHVSADRLATCAIAEGSRP